MIDIHNHIIPGIDDGAKDLDEALALLKMAADDGIKRLVLTPHLHLGRFDNLKGAIESGYKALKAAAGEAAIDIELGYDAEVRLDSDILILLAQDKIPFYGEHQGKKYMLLELPHSHIPAGCDQLIKYLLSQNIVPVIAHPERNRDLLKSPALIKPLKRLGCWFQITAGSITGQFGEPVQELAQTYLKEGFADIVASDAHSVKRRPVNLSQARAKVVELLGEEEALHLFEQNPYQITASQFA